MKVEFKSLISLPVCMVDNEPVIEVYECTCVADLDNDGNAVIKTVYVDEMRVLIDGGVLTRTELEQIMQDLRLHQQSQCGAV